MTGQVVSHYRILDKLGEGGMGVVYLAEDVKLRRKVAVKFLSQHVAENRERFLREAQAAASLNHPNICMIYEVDDEHGFIAMELIEGGSVKEKIAERPLRLEEALDIAIQTCSGLQAAHEKGIVHRDIKPANLLLTASGQVKITDFGLAQIGDRTRITKSGVAVGTPAYMSPEQVQGQPTDRRTDIWSTGVVLYEMISGKLPFPAETETSAAYGIVNAAPEPLTAVRRGVPMELDRIVAKALRKDVAERYAHVEDLLVDLRQAPMTVSHPQSESRVRSALIRALTLTIIAVVCLTCGWYFGSRQRNTESPSFLPVTFQRGIVSNARFSSDGRTVVYDAEWNGGASGIFFATPPNPESRAFGTTGAKLLALAASGEMAIKRSNNTLATAHTSGGRAPRDLLANVIAADWSLDGTRLAVVRFYPLARIEYPVGKPLHSYRGYVDSIRLSKGGDRIAFIDRPQVVVRGGAVRMVTPGGESRILSDGWDNLTGLAMPPSGNEVWFSAEKAGTQPALYAVTWDGALRKVAEFPGLVVLHDIAADGRVLLSRDERREHLIVSTAKDPQERDLSWLSASRPIELSPDGSKLLFDDIADASATGHSVYLRSTDGSPAIRIGDGRPLALSPDGALVAAFLNTPRPQLVLYPTGAGERVVLAEDALEYSAASFLPDGRRLVSVETGRDSRRQMWLIDIEKRSRKLVHPQFPPTAEGRLGVHVRHALSNDGRWVLGKRELAGFYVFPLDARPERKWEELQSVPLLTASDYPVVWTADNQAVYVSQREGAILRVYKVAIPSGQRALWRAFGPVDTAGAILGGLAITSDGRSYAYSYERTLSTLYIVTGLH